MFVEERLKFLAANGRIVKVPSRTATTVGDRCSHLPTVLFPSSVDRSAGKGIGSHGLSAEYDIDWKWL
jgi:hypothetical protein